MTTHDHCFHLSLRWYFLWSEGFGLLTCTTMIPIQTFLPWPMAKFKLSTDPFLSEEASWGSTLLVLEARTFTSFFVLLRNQLAQIHHGWFPKCFKPAVERRLQWTPYCKKERSTPLMTASCLCWMECQELLLPACPTGATLLLALRVTSRRSRWGRLQPDLFGTSVQVTHDTQRRLFSAV